MAMANGQEWDGVHRDRYAFAAGGYLMIVLLCGAQGRGLPGRECGGARARKCNLYRINSYFHRDNASQPWCWETVHIERSWLLVCQSIKQLG